VLEPNNIYLGDCLELMKQIPDKSIDCVITDPPYGLNIEKMRFCNTEGGIAKRNDYSDCFNDNRITGEYFRGIIRISNKQVIFGGNYYTDVLPQSNCWVIWDKKCDDKYTNDFADCELAWTSESKPSRVIRYLWHGMIQQNMKVKEDRVHPTQKPVPVMAKIIEMFTNENDLILDPFLGSGTTAIACYDLKRRYIGIEKEPKYFDIANKRINEFKAQLRMF
jgi:site-specific DNA-methyltransferase (adenine-specific)